MHALETSKLLTEEYSAKILLALMGRPSDKLDIPIAACYRKINLLESAGLICCEERKLTRAGKRVNMYKARVKSASIAMERNGIRARIEMIDGTFIDSDYCIDMDIFAES